MKDILAVLALGSAFCMSSMAHAAELQFSYAEVGGIDFTFDQSSDPTPIADSLGTSTQVAVTNWSGNIGPYSSIIWFNIASSGEFNTSDNDYVVYGPQIYTGTEDAPIFAPGVFAGEDQTNGLDGTLTITSVPEPASWAMVLSGFGLMGFVMRRRARMAISYS